MLELEEAVLELSDAVLPVEAGVFAGTSGVAACTFTGDNEGVDLALGGVEFLKAVVL